MYYLQEIMNETQHKASLVQPHVTRTSSMAISDCPVKWRAAESNSRDLSGFAEWLEMQSLRASGAPTGIAHRAALVSPCKVGYHIQGNHIGSSQKDILHGGS